VRQERVEHRRVVVARQAAVDDVAVVVRGVGVVGLVTAEVAILVDDDVEAARAQRAVGRRRVAPQARDVREDLRRLRRVDVLVVVERDDVVGLLERQQLIVLEPVLLPGRGRRRG